MERAVRAHRLRNVKRRNATYVLWRERSRVATQPFVSIGLLPRALKLRRKFCTVLREYACCERGDEATQHMYSLGCVRRR